MNDPLASLSLLLADVILPNLKSVQASQAEQIASNDRLEQAIEDLRRHLESQFAILSAQLTACQAELAATQAALKAAQTMAGLREPDNKLLIN
jgi:multidrug resistance efflux pump